VTVYRGNVFTNGVSSPGGNFDAKNNVEQVHAATRRPPREARVPTRPQVGKQGTPW
jgi:hypothetical protein